VIASQLMQTPKVSSRGRSRTIRTHVFDPLAARSILTFHYHFKLKLQHASLRNFNRATPLSLLKHFRPLNRKANSHGDLT